MLIGYDKQKPVYLIGRGMASRAWHQNLVTEGVTDIIACPIEEFDSVPAGSQCFLAILDVRLRAATLSTLDRTRYQWPTYLHPTCYVEDYSSLGTGVWIYSFSYVSCLANVGDFSVITSYSNVGHNTKLGQNNVLAVNTMIAGSVTTGDNVFFGIGTKVRDKLTIGSDTTFLMDSVVTKSIDQSGTYYGNRKTT